MIKRILIGVVVLLLVGACATWRAIKPPPEMKSTAQITIATGSITGGMTLENSDVNVFNGLPYAAPPVGDLRWAPPAPAADWGGVRDARAFGPECLQPRANGDGYFRGIINGLGLSWYKRKLAFASLKFADEPNEGEDCLRLNVRTANLATDATPQPVMVWIHGGSHQFGAGSTSIYQANGLVENGVVLVTINYRLGAFGYLAHPALTAASPNASSGNYGLLDQIAALTWVRDNISAFGGDPTNVTVFGESAGAQSITAMMASPLSEGLFHKAVLESGSGSYNRRYLDKALDGDNSVQDSGAEFLAPLIPAGSDATPEALRAIPATEIISRVEAAPNYANNFLPNVDGWVLPKLIGAAIADGDVTRVPVLAGYNDDEGTMFYPSTQSPTFLKAPFPEDQDGRMVALADIYGAEDAPILAASYGMDDPATYTAGATDMLGDDYFGMQMRVLGKSNASSGEPTWLYFFSRKPPSPKQTIGAFHASEIAFVFDMHSPFLKSSREDRALTKAMGLYWTNFAKTGNPNGEGLVSWPAYDGASDQWLRLDHEIEILNDHLVPEFAIMERVMSERIALSRALGETELASEGELSDAQ